MFFLRQGTATEVTIGPFSDSVDGNTPEGALTITQPDIRLKKNGAAWAQVNAAQTLSHEENGFFEVSLDNVDTDTLGKLRVAVHEAGALAVWEDFMVVTTEWYDAMCGAEILPVNASQIAESADTANNLKLLLQYTPGYITSDLAAGGGIDYIILGGTASTIDDFYNNTVIHLVGGTNGGQVRVIIDYDGGEKKAYVAEVWSGIAVPDGTTRYQILVAAAAVSDVNISTILNDAVATANMKAFFDGTGYNGGNGEVVCAQVTGTIAELNDPLSSTPPAVGDSPSALQAIYSIAQFLLAKTAAGTTVTVKNPNGTTHITLTVNDATTPTEINRTA